MAHTKAGTGLGHDIGGKTHVFLATGDDYISISATDSLSSQMQRLKAGAAYLIQGQRSSLYRQSGLDGSLSRGILSATSSQNLPHDDLIHQLCLDTCTVKQRADDNCAQFLGWHPSQTALETAYSCTSCSDNNNVLHGKSHL